MEKVQRRSEKMINSWESFIDKTDRQNNLGLFSFMSEGGYDRGLKNMWHG